MSPSEIRRFRHDFPCPICGGFDQMPRGEGTRCHGFLSSDEGYAHCSRAELAGTIPLQPDSSTYPHRLGGDCPCGARHATFGARAKSGGSPPRGRIVATYNYTDESGNLLFQIVRYQPKRFSIRRPDGSGGWIPNRKGVRLVLYRLPLILKAIQEKWRIYVVEGEKDADAINRLGRDGEAGFVATCNPFGARKWRRQYTQCLRGGVVTLVADKDSDGQHHAGLVLEALRHVAASLAVVEARQGKDASDHLSSGGTVADFVSVDSDTLPPPRRALEGQAESDLDADEEEGRSSNRESRATRLVALALRRCEVFHTPDGEGYADILIEEHRETWKLRSRGFNRWLGRLFYETEKVAPGSQALGDALTILEGEAQFRAPQRETFVRLAGFEGAIYLDLANDNWSAVEVSPTGWRVVGRPPVRFRRCRGMLPLPIPVREGSLDDLRPFLCASEPDDFTLTIAWLLAALRDRGPYPIAVLQGEQGSGKSSRARLLRALVDPSTVPLRRPPRSERDLAITAHNCHVLPFDNLSGMAPWMSDALCSLATGGGFGTRELYTDAEEMLFEATRPLIINGIDDLLTRPDLTDRAIAFHLPQMERSKRRDELELWAAFEEIRPRVLGALLDAVSAAQRALPLTRLQRPPRMADFARWCVAAEPSLGWPDGTFLRAFGDRQQEAIEIGLESDLVAGCVRGLLAERGQWVGTASDLLIDLNRKYPEQGRHGKHWPAVPKSLADRLRRLAPSLRAVGLGVEMGTRESGTRRRLIHLSLTGEENTQSCGPCGPCGPNTDGTGIGRDAETPARTAGGTQSQSPEPASSGPETARTAETAGVPGSRRALHTAAPTHPGPGPAPDDDRPADAGGPMEEFEL